MDKGMTMNVNVTKTRLLRMPNPRRGGYKTKSRIYICPEYCVIIGSTTDGAAIPAAGMPNPRRGGYKTKSRIYICPEGETILENFNNQRTRPLGLYRESALKALDKLEIDRTKLSIKWSQKAGCRCGCSPGFIVDGWNSTLDGKSLYVTITCD